MHCQHIEKDIPWNRLISFVFVFILATLVTLVSRPYLDVNCSPYLAVWVHPGVAQHWDFVCGCACLDGHQYSGLAGGTCFEESLYPDWAGWTHSEELQSLRVAKTSSAIAESVASTYLRVCIVLEHGLSSILAANFLNTMDPLGWRFSTVRMDAGDEWAVVSGYCPTMWWCLDLR